MWLAAGAAGTVAAVTAAVMALGSAPASLSAPFQSRPARRLATGTH
jgi:hypothetical protein